RGPTRHSRARSRAAPGCRRGAPSVGRGGAPSRGPPRHSRARNRGAPRFSRGAPSVGGCGGPFRGPPPVLKKYLARRAVYAVVTLLGVSLSIFVILRILPGDPLVAILGVEGHARMMPADRVRIMADLGLSDPLPVQYVRWLHDIAVGRLGKSFFRGDTVADLISHRGPISAEIGVLALVVSWLVGLPVGILSAFKPNSLPDGVARMLSILFIAIPGFWLGMLIVL